jgi:hypothetical protein
MWVHNKADMGTNDLYSVIRVEDYFFYIGVYDFFGLVRIKFAVQVLLI